MQAADSPHRRIEGAAPARQTIDRLVGTIEADVEVGEPQPRQRGGDLSIHEGAVGRQRDEMPWTQPFDQCEKAGVKQGLTAGDVDLGDAESVDLIDDSI